MTSTDPADLPIGFTVRQRIFRPVAEVFDAVVDPETLCRYLTESASGPLEQGKTVRWSWPGGDVDEIRVLEVVEDRRLMLTWTAFGVSYETRCALEFEEHGDGLTIVQVSETGWQNDEPGRMSSYEHCHGWSHMLVCLKAWVEHGLDLR